MMAIVFGSPEAVELVAKAKEMGMALAPDEATLAIVAERIWDMVMDTYADNLGETSDGSIVLEKRWKDEMIKGIVGILKGWRP